MSVDVPLVADVRVAERPARQPASKPGLVGLTRQELADALIAAGERPDSVKLRARQLWHWLYHRGATSFAAMTTIAKDMRGRLDANFVIDRPAVAVEQKSSDLSRKWLLRFADGEEAECVHIPESDRGALCLSSQVGCTLNCRFCHTGTQRLVRNLGAAEILGQIMVARDSLGEWPSPKGGRMISNLVMMGMGEPLYNFENVAKALKIAMDHEGIALSKRRITLSTAGVIPMMKRAGDELGVNLAVSLHAVRDDLRDELVPLNKKYPIAPLLDACRAYPTATNARRITFEYVMLKGVNDTEADARELVRLIRDIPSKANLIPFNPWPGAPYECSAAPAMRRFAQIVNDAGYASPIRTPRGRDIMAACGQLKSASVKKRKSDLLREQAGASLR